MTRAKPLITALFLLTACNRDIALALLSDGGVRDAGGPSTTSSFSRNKVDLLFVIGDSMSMAPAQDALKSQLERLVDDLYTDAMNGGPVDYHIGVVTSDVTAPGLPSCGSGLDGQLQKRGLATTNSATCQGPSDNFIQYDLSANDDNLPVGQSLVDTLDCMMTVVDPVGTTNGHYGCTFPQPLEAAYLALTSDDTTNAGFLRDDAALVIVFVSNEDDCSVPVNSDLFTNPDYGPLNPFRCAQYGIFCDGEQLPSTVDAGLVDCTTGGSKLYDFSRYIDLFTTPGRLKADPANDIFLVAIAAPTTPLGTYTASGAASCGTANRAPVTSCTNLSPSCVSTSDPSLSGTPPLRLATVVSSVQHSQTTSICSTDDSAAVDGIASGIEALLAPPCLTAPVGRVKIGSTTRPDCVVTDTSGAGSTTLPYCGQGSSAVFPCWTEIDNPSCPPVCNPQLGYGESFRVIIERDGTSVPVGNLTSVTCNTIAADPAACGDL